MNTFTSRDFLITSVEGVFNTANAEALKANGKNIVVRLWNKDGTRAKTLKFFKNRTAAEKFVEKKIAA